MGRLSLRVQPGARRERLVGWMANGTLKVAVAAPPEAGKANLAVTRLLAMALGVEVGAVRVVRGTASRSKVIEVEGLDDEVLRRRVAGALER